jgi:ABC-2 type transport system ATP-binding protein
VSGIAIETEGLTCEFGDVCAVDALTLSVPAGVVFGFLGPNGAGKTTTIRLLLGLLEPTRGRATVLGYDTVSGAAEIRLRTGALLEHPGIYERLSAEDNLDFYGRIWGPSAADRRQRIKELLAQFGLWERRGERAGTWSRGMKQKLAVARAMLQRPPLIFLDEPTSGLDPVSAAALRDDLAALATNEGTTVFITTHNLVEAEKLCARVGVIRKGRLLDVGHPDELRARVGGPQAEIVGRGFDEPLLAGLRQRPEVAQARVLNGRLLVDLRGDTSLAPVVRHLVCAGAEVEEVHRGAASLEDAFLAMVEETDDKIAG